MLFRTDSGYTNFCSLPQRNPLTACWKKGAKDARERHGWNRIISKITAFGDDQRDYLHPQVTSESSKRHNAAGPTPFSSVHSIPRSTVYTYDRFNVGRAKGREEGRSGQDRRVLHIIAALKEKKKKQKKGKEESPNISNRAGRSMGICESWVRRPPKNAVRERSPRVLFKSGR